MYRMHTCLHTYLHFPDPDFGATPQSIHPSVLVVCVPPGPKSEINQSIIWGLQLTNSPTNQTAPPRFLISKYWDRYWRQEHHRPKHLRTTNIYRHTCIFPTTTLARHQRHHHHHHRHASIYPSIHPIPTGCSNSGPLNSKAGVDWSIDASIHHFGLAASNEQAPATRFSISVLISDIGVDT